MEVIKLKMRNYAMLQMTECAPHIVSEISEHFCFEVPGAKFMPAVKKRIWDGKIRLFNRTNGELNAGLYESLRKFAAERGYGIKVEEGKYGYPYDKNKVPHMAFQEFIESLNLPFKPRDYQYDAIVHGIEHKRSIILSPTGSGKSLIIYILARWYLAQHNMKLLLIVPTTSLVEQMYKDFYEYGYDVEKNVHRIYSGKDKVTDCPVIISTWQSIYKLGSPWFQQFGCIVGDEVHGFKSKSLSSIMNKSTEAEYRFGTTGTLDGTTVHKLVLEGLFGPTYTSVTTAKLQEDKHLAKLDIDIILLKYKRELCQLTDGRTYQDEIDFIVQYEKRNNFIANLAASLEGNTLVLFNLVDKHGKVLRPLIENRLKDGQRFFFVSGETKTTDREQIRNIVDLQNNSIILASLGTFSTGINIKNIHNIIFASPSKSQIRVLQSIGRGLRLSDNGSTTRLYDIADDLHIKSKKNFTLLHSAERVKIYAREKFPFKITQVPI
jgi:superfamily II DNA or RNA helicase|tara:strand:- start:20923 stop:22398 length:1476 start_codon:yes stop_codon:yes gene_type:complete